MCDGSGLRRTEDKCKLTNDLQINEKLKFSFWYYMYGSTIGTLELKRDDQVLWSKTGRQKNEWLYAVIILEPGSFEVKIYIYL